MCGKWAGRGSGQWQGIWELGKPSAVHTVLSAFLISVFSESALAKFSRKPLQSTAWPFKGRHLFPPVTLTSQKLESREIRMSPLWSGTVGASTYFQKSQAKLVIICSLLPVAVWGAALALKRLAQWPSTSVWCCSLPPSGPQGSWSKAPSRQKVGFLEECQPEARQDLKTCPKPTKFLTVDCWEWGQTSMSTDELVLLVVLVCQRCFHYIVNFTKMFFYLYVILTFIFGYGLLLMRIFLNKTLRRDHLFLKVFHWLWKFLSNHWAWGAKNSQFSQNIGLFYIVGSANIIILISMLLYYYGMHMFLISNK